MSVAENIFLGREPCNGMGVIDKKQMLTQTRKLLGDLNLDIDPLR